MLLIVFLASFGTTGCFELFPNSVVDGVYYFHPNHNGSVKMITKSEGGVVSVVARYKYKPYGEMLADKSSGTDVSKYKYTAQESDDSTGLYYYNARFYDPSCGRFITADSIVPNPTDTQAFNRYMYAGGDPISMHDPDGHWSLKKWVEEKKDDLEDWGEHGKSHEWQNQYKHWFTGNIIFIFFTPGDSVAGFISGLAIGLVVEIHQYFNEDEMEPHHKDRLRDILFYGIGGAGIPVPYQKMNEDGPWPWQWKEREKKEEVKENKENQDSYQFFDDRFISKNNYMELKLNTASNSLKLKQSTKQMFNALKTGAIYIETYLPKLFFKKGIEEKEKWAWGNSDEE